MPNAHPDTSLLRRWLRRLLFAWLGTIAYSFFTLWGGENLAHDFACAFLLVFPFWIIFLARAAIGLAPRRTAFFWVIPALVILATLVVSATLTTVATLIFLTLRAHAAFPNVFSREEVEDSSIIGLTIGLLASGVWLITPRRAAPPKFFHCAKCNYQLQGSLHANRCPECGHFLLVGEDIPYLPQNLTALENFSTPEEIQTPNHPKNRHKSLVGRLDVLAH